MMECPKCKSYETEPGYGLAGGGLGFYMHCSKCDTIYGKENEMKDAMNEADPAREVTITYTNHRGEKALRYIVPISVEFCSTEWHPKEQWILHAHDTIKGEDRSFALKDISDWTPSEV